ncbi:hypothetical protein JCM33374_g3312 [Metschnikowia sp. JCM 33374]|nr:hypothetical protein JCM33374_g3312 [Metschnikowia sp. JCM 33374]
MTLTSFQAVPKPVLQSDSGSDSGSGSDSSSGSSSGSGSDSSSDSDSELRLSRPVFLKKKQKVSSTPSHDSSRAALAKAEHLQQIESKSSDKVPFDGIDDSDDIDPEEEYKQWQLREASRKKRDAKITCRSRVDQGGCNQAKEGFT